jgi:hypothetical protein
VTINASDALRDLSRGFARTFDEVAEETVFGDPHVESALVRAEGLRHLTRVLATAALVEVEAHDRAYPHFGKFVSLGRPIGFANPDCSYTYAALHGDFSYRIFGRRGTAHMFDIEVRAGDLADWTSAHIVGGRRDFHFGPLGEFEVVLSREKREGDWLALPTGPVFIVVRQIFYDWETEAAADIYIEREEATYPPPPVTTAYYTERFQLFVDAFAGLAKGMAKGVEFCHYQLPQNSINFQPVTMGDSQRGQADQFGWRDALLGWGIYRCEEDQAVVVELALPEAKYWTLYLMSQYWEALDFSVRQTSINGHQAVLDADGVFRAVIAHRDPQVPNWLDASGHTTGLLLLRYVEPTSTPIPELRVVPLEDLRSALPAATRVVTAEERTETIRRRMHSVRRRMCDH